MEVHQLISRGDYSKLSYSCVGGSFYLSKSEIILYANSRSIYLSVLNVAT
jgi:hypothetical protein